MKRKKAISYSLFGFGKERAANCFDFHSYLRGLLINVRLNRLIFPDWEIVLHTDPQTYEAYKFIFENIGITTKVETEAPLCLAMLWRMKPIFEMEAGAWKYSHVICRDLDSPTTYRDAQAVAQWIESDKAAHAICDSVSHSIPLMGGMIGFKPDYITEKVGQTWDEMLTKSEYINFDRKGSDQDFLNRVIYPAVGTKGTDSITQHYVLGHGDTFLSDFHNHIPDIDIGLDESLKETDLLCGHIGAAGYYSPTMERFLSTKKELFKDIQEVEKKYPRIFYWTDPFVF